MKYAQHLRTLVLTVLTVACSAKPPSVDDALGTDATPTEPPPGKELTLAERGARMQVELNRVARAARDHAAAHGTDADAQADAARALFVSADLEVGRGVIASLDADGADDLKDLFAREDKLDKSLKQRVVALADEGARFARAAIDIDGDRPDARYYYAVNLGFGAWARGAAGALFSGVGTKVKGAINDAVEAGSDFEEAAPLRARAGLLARAPWPMGDKKAALEVIRRAIAIADVPSNRLYLAEILWRNSDTADATEEWRRVVAADNAPPFTREFARRALAIAQTR